MKNRFKNTIVIAIAILYCFGIGMSGNGISESVTFLLKSSGPETENVSKITAELSHHIVQPAGAKFFAKAGHPKFLKLSFSGLVGYTPIAGHVAAQSFSQFVKRSQNLLFFTNVDIIYPFHSFW
ncbi:hypothetical protein HYN59_06270 [Flavobacterium album]|uniref:Uncharacterized protein n=1 Tax=Flavobacterium album TaxID=2175091 RepID=A0A2S1QWF7_9FLAO|nr:hypothetical protein [Flavobacterium album]AWH84750.1 hypothetical protein HYN59_06270 [Flavobacterium album]